MRKLTRLLRRRPACPPALVEAVEAAPAPILELTLADLHRPDRVEAATRGTGVDLGTLFAEIGVVADYVGRLRGEVAALRPGETVRATLPAARADLASVQADSERAGHSIVSAAEAILALGDGLPPEARRKVSGLVTGILEACSFHDLAGQRLARTLAVLAALEERLGAFVAATAIPDAAVVFDRGAILAQARRDVLLVGGPAAAPAEQSEVDRLFP